MARATIPIPQITPSDKLRFWDKISNQETFLGCHEWLALKSTEGYGNIRIGKRMLKATRIAYFLETGVDPKELHVCHRCDNPKCVNPSHLFLGTDADNMQDMIRKGRGNKASGDKNGKSTKPERTPRGQKHGMSKLTDSDILAIRADPRFQMEIAADYGVVQSVISSIKRRQIWKHVA